MNVLLLRRFHRRELRRNRVFRDRTHPFEEFDDIELFRKFRFRRHHILSITDSVREELELTPRLGTLTPLLQVMVALRFYASGTFQDVCGELIGISQPTVSRTIARVTEALLRHLPTYVKLPSQEKADRTKVAIFTEYGFPGVFGCIDGTQVRIEAPSEYEHEFVNRKNYHSINVQVICDADLVFMDCVVKWPGSVHDSRILRQSALFDAFESDNRKPLEGVLLGDSGYMLRDWLLTPILRPNSPGQTVYNAHHKSARSIVERSIGILKRRWHCLRRLRLDPVKACNVITVCIILHNRARMLNVEDPGDSDSDADTEAQDEAEDDQDDDEDAFERPDDYDRSERVRTAVGKAARQRIVENYFD